MRKSIFGFLLALVILVLFPISAQSSENPLTLLSGADYAGNDYRTIKDTTLESCSMVCSADSKCQAFTFNTKANWCFLKSKAEMLMPFSQAVAGSKSTPKSAIGKAKAAELNFLESNVAEAAEEFAIKIRSDLPPDNKDPAAINLQIQTKIAAQDFLNASVLSKSLITLGDENYETWRNLAFAINALQSVDPAKLDSYNQEYLSAAYQAYLHSTNAQQNGEALSLLGSALVRTGATRPAIEAYRMALAAFPSPTLSAAFDDAKAKYGFRVLDFKVNADETDPRVCVKFSEELKKGRVDYAPFVSVEGAAAAAVQANASELCIAGIKRGQRVALTIRDGLPAEIDEKTLKPVTLSVFIRDRSPTVHFTGQKYVLPGQGRHGVPVVSINATEINIDVYHIPERGLAGFIKGTQFLSQISDYDAKNIKDDSGEKIWSGLLSVAAKSNEEVTTSFPLDDVLKNRLPGIYVMLASPAGVKSNDYNTLATQWLIVSDLGVTTLSNNNGMSVFVRSLNSAQALANTEITLVAHNNSVLGKSKTDANGLATFDGGLMRGTGGNAPAIVTVDGPNRDFGFIDINRAAYDFSDRGVGGRIAPGPIDVFMYTERGIYRPGHTVHLSAIARDDKAVAITGLPLTFIVTRPDGVEYQRYSLQDAGLGSYNVNFDLKSTAMRGMWTVSTYTDPKQSSIASVRFRVDDFIPDRFEYDLKSAAQEITLDGPTEATVDARFLYGAPASGLKVQGDLSLKPTRNIAEYPGYNFGLEEKNQTSGRTEFAELGTTDDDGKATLSYQPTEIPQTSQPLEAALNVRIVDDGGRAIERNLTLPAALSSAMIGIKPKAAEFAEGQLAQFDVIEIDKTKLRIPSGPLTWELVRVRDEFQWYQKNGIWAYEATEYSDHVANGKFEIGIDQAAQIEAQVEWGHYRVIVESADPNGPTSSYDFYAGWYVPQTTSDSPDVLQIALDKPQYKIGDTAVVKIVPRFAGTALVNIVGEKLVDMKAIDVPVGGTEVSFKVTEDWAPGTYVEASLFKPANTESKMPGRAIGIAPVKKDESTRTITVALDPPKQMRPRTKLTIPITLGNIQPGEPAFVTVAAVDVGVLNVTRYTPPDASGWFYGQRRLAMELRDIYGQLINGSLGETGVVRSGGGDEDAAAGKDFMGSPPATEVVSLYSGIVPVGADGKAMISFDVPEFNGKLRLMVVAWSKNSIGNASNDVIVRDPVVISESLPRVLAPGDSARLQLAIENTDGPNGEYNIGVKPSAGLDILQNKNAIQLVKGKRQSITLPMQANAAGLQTVDVTLTHASGLKILKHMSVFVRPAQLPNSSRRIVTLNPGQSLALTPEMLANQVAGTGSITASITRSGALDIPGILQALDRYPYGCTEQTTSRALPLIYLDEVASHAGLEGDKAVKERVQDAIYRVLANQSSEGSFGLWNSTPSDDLWLDSYVSDFLTRAKEKGYDIPQKAFENAIANLQNIVAITPNVEEKPSDIAYALYVLTRNKKASIGDLRFYAETKLDSFPSPMAKAQLASALALYGDKPRATAILDAALKALRSRKEEDWFRSDYGSNLRDSAALLTYAVEVDQASPLVAKLTDIVVRFQTAARWTSTQEESWMLLAAQSLLSSADAPKISVNGKSFQGDYVKKFNATDLLTQPNLVNNSDHPIDAILTTTGVVSTPASVSGNGFRIERNYFLLDGKPADLALVHQNDRLVVTIKVVQANAWPAKIMITDLLPSGFEIDNPALVSSASLENFSWLKESPADAYLQFRDDRFAAALTRPRDSDAEVNFAYVVRAVTPGKFTLPPAQVEDMYRPFLNANTATGQLEVK